MRPQTPWFTLVSGPLSPVVLWSCCHEIPWSLLCFWYVVGADDGPSLCRNQRDSCFSGSLIVEQYSIIYLHTHTHTTHIYIYSTTSLSIHLFTDTYVVSMFWLLWIMMLWISGCIYLFQLAAQGKKAGEIPWMVKIKTLNDRNILWGCPESGAQTLNHLKLGAPCKENEGVQGKSIPTWQAPSSSEPRAGHLWASWSMRMDSTSLHQDAEERYMSSKTEVLAHVFFQSPFPSSQGLQIIRFSRD